MSSAGKTAHDTCAATSEGDNMKKTIMMLSGLLIAFAAIAAEVSQDAALLNGYMRYLLCMQVQQQADLVAQNAKDGDSKQVADYAASWFSGRMEGVRKDLVDKFGDDAQSKFVSFMKDYDAAEKNNDKNYLTQLCSGAGMSAAMQDYKVFKQTYLESNLRDDLGMVSTLLSELQTWADLRCRTNGVPELDFWINRHSSAVKNEVVIRPDQIAVIKKVKKPSIIDPLESAEAGVTAMEEQEDEPDSPMDMFSDMRSKRRDRALEEAQAGMQQIAQERQAAEQEYAAKKTAAAQAEADNLKNHADKIAASEKDAIDQQANSWSTRLKSIVGATVGAATGAFTGGLGATAGQMAVNAVFGGGYHAPANPNPSSYSGSGTTSSTQGQQ